MDGDRDAAGVLRDLVQPCTGLGNIGSGPVDVALHAQTGG